MGQRHQYIVVYPAMFLNKDNPNNRPECAEVFHHQWLFGRSAILALRRSLQLIKNSWDGEGSDHLFGRSDNGYTGGEGTQALAAAVSVDPSEGYYHDVHLWEPEDWNDMVEVPAGKHHKQKLILPSGLKPGMFDNNDGITLIRFKTGEALPGYAFITPNHIEGSHWKDRNGRGPWSAEEYVKFYYSEAEQQAWEPDIRIAMLQAFGDISKLARLMDPKEVAELLPGFKLAKPKARKAVQS